MSNANARILFFLKAGQDLFVLSLRCCIKVSKEARNKKITAMFSNVDGRVILDGV
jgi:hypothetical protein